MFTWNFLVHVIFCAKLLWEHFFFLQLDSHARTDEIQKENEWKKLKLKKKTVIVYYKCNLSGLSVLYRV